ncbi:6274_t:CDS:2 [Funneliformis mosseae]|uniref:6274_t:CDS:1 n=1 Tax=Funneliformis mosseae TaxID=27381 RepID=A0A9N9GBY5_FUNMO|nr:6274_t:CDS:2 [Funneliformis mosseae]
MLRRTFDTVSLVFGGACLGAFCYYQYEKLRLKPPAPAPAWKPQLVVTKEMPNAGPISDFLQRKAYYTSYNRQLRHPSWVLEHITKESLMRGEGVDRSKSRFQEDEDIPEKFRARLLDYVRSGYDRGHMAPASDAKTTQETLDETFLLTNIAPQVGNGFNRDYWAHFEEFCRRLITKEEFKSVYVFTGPAYLPKKDEKDQKFYVKYEIIGNPPNIAVPTHYFKVILATKDDSSKPDGELHALGAFLLPNDRISNTTPLQTFDVPLDALERTTGLTFFDQAIKDSSIHLCKVSKCILVANPKYVKEELRSALPEPTKNNK